ncbi:MAG: hypothetical protein A3C03_02585 [Candidatus Colwellbacteria bacterium RIFCSPHIGHO2_02_FULL_45_17]|uniref:DHHA1 domain-containing protein n=1 Tax=Candidatus Colwellbacteria bacterium RIFCSPLOWO2_12_FULL_46_17 TaxID=1797695 RepID=A0A1G1ZFF4_9BACT|nr:MAG: hypothetical protein A3C03_02585 [Candidatus Colwellbacteria bacterium RIFCSPHIGHO2_02_FULL_45_17]OGY62700.1 MAG: hypothetical protein A3G58_01965 [Candidatus Colwellbacteria bacterium RIFCSPLOWO2_12_FULL_46_17]
MLKDTVVLYHNNCTDGFSGAWAARKKFGKRADYLGVIHHEPPPPGLDGKDVFIIDFSYSKETTGMLLDITKSLTLIDHHITSKEVTESIPNHVFDNDHSGAVLAWEYFFPGEKTPVYLEYVEDIDLWRFDMPRAEDFLAFSATVPFDFEKLDAIIEEFEDENKRKAFLGKGKDLLEYQIRLVEEMIEEGEEVNLDGFRALVVNSPVLPSQLGNTIVRKGYDIGIIWAHSNDVIRVSLRSDKDGKVNVGDIAQKYGGGGHKSAAGFVVRDESEFPWQTKNT